MNIFSELFAISAGLGFLACIMFVVFGQITVRKLRKNPVTKDALGTEFSGGWDILNVAGALSTPEVINRRMASSRLAFLRADPELLYKNTTRLDRILARIFFVLFYTSSFMMVGLVLLNSLGAFGS